MTAPDLYPKHAFNVVPGERQLTVRELFFRWLLRRAKRRPAVPAAPRTAGTATALPPGAEPVLRNGTIAEARARQDAWTAEDVAVTGHPATEPAGFPSLLGPVRQDAAPVNGPLPRRIPGASVREHGSWT
jgi:hypothetical protein